MSKQDEADQHAHRNVELITINSNAEAQRVDNFLITHWKGVPKSRIYRLIRKGEIRLNKKRIKPETRLHVGDLLRLPPIRMADPVVLERPGPGLQSLLRESIIFENDDLLVINKPQGVAVHAGSGQRTGIIEALRWMRMEEEGADVFLELAHRIDKDTSGCLVICKNALTLKHVQEALKSRQVSKVYLALVHGHWPRALEEIDAPLQKTIVSDDEKVVKVSKDGKPARTLFKVLKQFDNATLVEARPLSGRMHQIRVHCQYAGHPIIGDSKYTLSEFHNSAESRRLCLHAASITLELPHGKGNVTVNAPVNPRMDAIMRDL